MRIHRLEIQAFGPFVERQVIDFDRLGEQGLFLLNGATGAGKTSVLDAICFALYGAVPGARQDGNHLRSDHALAELEPLVVLEFSVSRRLFDVERSPAWQRPAKRGNSTVTEQARTLLREKVNGRWQVGSSRSQEVGAEIAALLGMNREQFTKVVMLAQGEFAAFLRAQVKDRKELLQKLFGTDYFEAVEEQLNRHAVAVRTELNQQEAVLGKLLEDAREQVNHFLPRLPEAAELDWLGFAVRSAEERPGVEQALSEPASQSGLEQPDFADLQEWMRRAQQYLEAQLGAAESEASRAKEQLEAARALSQRHQALILAEAAVEEVAEGLPEQRNRQQLVEQHRAAQGFASESTRLQQAESEVQKAQIVAKRAQQALPAAQATSDAAGWEAASRAAAAQATLIKALLPEQRLLDQDLAKHAAGVAELSECQRRAADLDEQLSTLRQQQDALSEARETTEQAASKFELTAQNLADSAATLEAVREHQKLAQKLSGLSEELQAAKTQQLEAKEHWLALLAERLERSAAELAAGLQPDQPCPVCGSLEHPSPAPGQHGDAQLAVREDAARKKHETQERLAALATDRHAQAHTELAALAARGGNEDLETVQAQHKLQAQLHQRAKTAQGELERFVEQLGELRTGITRLEETAQHVHHRELELGVQLSSLEASITQRETKLNEHLEPGDSMERKLQECETTERLLHEAIASHRALGHAEAELEKATELLEGKLSSSSFSSAADLELALRSEAELQELEAAMTSYQEADIRAKQALAADPVQEALRERAAGAAPATPEQLAELLAFSQRADGKAKDAAIQRALAAQLSDTVQTSAQRFAALEEKLLPQRENSQMLTELADTARGLGNNNYKMPLSAYVLAARLEQVAAAATERLLTMSGRRYSLEYTDALAGRSRKSGLGLEVIDGWTGKRRDTSTLSGGESFMASLALALGLADVVQQESGGMQIETLFVDEGFGSLDEESLDQVMTSLENLRDSGRTVGLVSHVAEMKLRIPMQLEVTKGQHGSTLKTRLLNQLE
ncbi:AAA family ATPase [Psychromicrobium sp. YIM B11713]|uniref:AAA family ATPase n=1 Tax=Psychromicrobium sp. YIM B11713 TaxID=3145233 RepID=UPI00374FBEB7